MVVASTAANAQCEDLQQPTMPEPELRLLPKKGVMLQVRTLKQQNNALADEASNAKFKLVDAQQEQLKLKGQIVEVTITMMEYILQHKG